MVRFGAQLSMNEEIIVDNFAGGGGASTGIELACGRPVTIEARDRELNRQGNARRYWREMGPRKETGNAQ